MCRGERVIAVSDTVKQYILSNYPDTPESNIHLIYRGVDPAEWPYCYQASPEWKRAFFSDFPQLEGKRLLCLPGRLTRLKGHNDFLNLLSTLTSEFEDIHAIIVGGEDPKRKEYANELYQRVKDLGLEDRVTFTGARKDIREIFSISEIIYSLSTKPESFGRTVLEALSLGRPVLGYDHGGVGEVLLAVFGAGRVTVSESSELKNKSRTQLEGQVDAVKEQACFTKEAMLESTLSVYKSLMD
jgi:glycosyltransferase involved in cell wall biosynthesis